MTPLPELIRVKLGMVRQHQREGEFGLAQSELDDALSAYPGHPLLLVQQGKLHLAAGRVEEAAALAAEMLAEHPGSAGASQLSGEVLMRQGRAREAHERFLEADRRAPSPYLKTQIVRSLVKAREFDEAIRAGEEALRALPDDSHLLKALEYAYAQAGRPEDAARICDRLLALAPEDARATAALVKNRLAALPEAEAAIELEALLRVPTYAKNAALQSLAGERHYKAGRFAEALAACRIAQELAPGDRMTLQRIGFCHYRLEQYGEAIAILEPLFQEEPSNSYIRSTFVAACTKAGRTEELGAAIDRALAAHPGARFLHGVRKKALKAQPPG